MTGIKDVAKAAGVSVSTVSYVLSGKRAISGKTADKVMEAVRRLEYTPDASAQKMRGLRNQILAVSEPIRGDIRLFGCLCGCGSLVRPSGYWRPGSWRSSPPHLSMTRLMRLSRLR